jgi:hypothetical protein
MVRRIKPRVRSTKASLSARQLSNSTPTPKCPDISVFAISAMYSQIHQVVGLDQDKESLCRRRLDLGELAPEVLDIYLVQMFVERDGIRADKLEAPAQRTEDIVLGKGPRPLSLLDVRVLRDLGQFSLRCPTSLNIMKNSLGLFTGIVYLLPGLNLATRSVRRALGSRYHALLSSNTLRPGLN